ncbi:MAG: hypothetical protein L0Y76_02580, partial [Ignavibacteria bacterium]|nr:hypothetical protein [Ignavibacteria bacterium]
RNILDDINLKTRLFFQSGKRYTPQLLTGYLETGRPEYTPDYDNINGDVAQNWFNIDVNIDKYIRILNMDLVLNLAILNLLNTDNSAIINPVTGRAYEYGDSTPNSWNDPLYPDLQAPLNPYPFNPSRYSAPRNVKFGVSVKF